MRNPKRQPFERSHADTLEARLGEPRRFLQIVAGPRQVGKTTLVNQVLDRLDAPNVFFSADEPALGDTAWLAAQWDRARIVAGDAGKAGAVLALDEVQKIPGWSETAKRLWDEDSRARRLAEGPSDSRCPRQPPRLGVRRQGNRQGPQTDRGGRRRLTAC